MATLMSAALTLLGQDLDDDWSSTASANGDSAGTYLTDDNLYEKVEDWVIDGMIIYLTLGPSGSGSPETRVVDRIENNKLYPKTAFSAQVVSTAAYVIHRLFTRTAKLVALRNGTTLLCPGIHAVVRDMTTEVEDFKYEYDISSLAIYQNRPHQVLLAQKDIEDIWVASTVYAEDAVVRPTGLSTFSGYTYICTTAGTSDSSEPTWPTSEDSTVADNTVTWTRRDDIDYSTYPMIPLHDWDITPNGYLRLNETYTDGRKLMIVGIKPLAFTGSGANETLALDSPFDVVLTAQAAKYLWDQRVSSAGNQNVELALQQAQYWASKLATRKMQNWMKPPDGTIITGPGLTV